MKKGVLYGIVASSKTRVRCVFCRVHIPKANKCIEQHTNGAKHKDNIILMTENGMIFRDDELYCKPCKRVMDEEESVSKHIDSESHANWQAAIEDLTDGEYIQLEPYLTSEKEEAFCEVCKKDINCSLQVIESHVNSIVHRGNILEKLKPLNGIFAVDNDEEVYCKVCDAYVDNTVQTILEHIDDDEEHIEWFAEMEDLIEEQDVSLERYLANENEVNVYCKRCDLEIICDIQSIENHVHSESHLNNLG
ncbi:uncharacterized protein LOC128678794 [Plodia interpunctella]|uniref:uncharacterized protein LOC128678794 n=1 Tax=Plodia interpunctella TaxID=58824 RepID=UPI002367A465|nr:uncharacterized protein LOC128678794 [Plodia interpunctella]